MDSIFLDNTPPPALPTATGRALPPNGDGSRAPTQRDPSSVMFVLFVSSDSGQAYIFPVMTTNIIIYILKLRF